MTDTPILRAGQARNVAFDGVTYTIRALSYGEHADLQVARAERAIPGNDILDDALATAARAAGRDDLAAGIAELHAAEDELGAFYDAAPPILDEAGRVQYWTEKADDLRGLQRAVRVAGRKRRLALDLFGEAEGVKALRTRAAEALRAASIDLVMAGVTAVDGKPVRLDAAAAAALPSPHVAALSAAIGEMLAPSRDAAKN